MRILWLIRFKFWTCKNFQDLFWYVWSIHWSRVVFFFSFLVYCLRLGFNWTLVTDGWCVVSCDISVFYWCCFFSSTNENWGIVLFVLAMGMGLCVAFIAFVRLPSLKVSTLLLTGLLIYDVFWVFFSSYIFSTNVMVKVNLIHFSCFI